jgi:hypothetical protein
LTESIAVVNGDITELDVAGIFRAVRINIPGLGFRVQGLRFRV